ncbi:hypothetical protein MF672_038830 [Actinomadura sp. ATCC 31491]|uniref:DUF2190 family protein n=1 Tax=Actinomadura luzonensis TaxID=2805427 RepID=A0ABT0G526_9ACTN|nr:hypothetical protein [Actinomadura luzonensis]MCK2219709.1 hypothetical protein [Actinomadura luzonensis]
MATRIPDAVRNAAADAVVDRIDTGSTNAQGRLRIYTGTQPASANTAPSGTLLAEVSLANPAFSASSAGVATLLGTPLSTTGVAAGTAGWFRIVDRDANTVLDGSAGTSGTELILNTTTISIGATVQITAGTITMPAG